MDFQPRLTGTITLTTGELAMNKDLTIEGPGVNVITVSGNHASRVLNIANFTVAISGLTIGDGELMNDDGGGIISEGTLTITNTIFSGNTAYPGNLGLGGSGGGIFNTGDAKSLKLKQKIDETVVPGIFSWSALAFSPDSKRLAVAGLDKAMVVISLSQGDNPVVSMSRKAQLS